MLDIRDVRNRKEEFVANIRNRNLQIDLEGLFGLDAKAREIRVQLEETRRLRNETSQHIQQASLEKRKTLSQEGKHLRQKEDVLSTQQKSLVAKMEALLQQAPNFSHPETPRGNDDADNKVLRVVGEQPTFSFAPKDHLTLMQGLGLVDFEAGARVAGQKFYFLKNEAVLLEFALVQFVLEVLRKKNFTLYTTPDLAKKEIVAGVGYNPRGSSSQIYSVENSDLCLVATAEIPLGGMFAGKVIPEEECPLLLAGVSHCFRTEAGAAGRESKGLYRVHQFTKVEMFAFTLPEQSESMHFQLLEIEEEIYQMLNIPYRVVDVCTGDLGGPAYRKYDLEAWMPSREGWGEITSTSNCTDYQARRLNIRYKPRQGKKTPLVHMLNGTAVAITRTIMALIENGQRVDGSIQLPACLNLGDLKRC